MKSPRSAPLSWFFATAFAISWGAWWPVSLGAVSGSWSKTTLTVIGVFGPFLAAALVTKLIGDSIRSWLAPALRWRARPRWYAAVSLLPVLASALTAGAHVALGGSLTRPLLADQGSGAELPVVYFINVALLFLIGGGQEEPGWRGFALLRLLERFDPLSASLLLGAAWALWHLPLFFLEGASHADIYFAPYCVGTLALSVMFTWLHIGTRGSVFMAMLFHATVNAGGLLDPIGTDSQTVQWLGAAVLVASAAVLIAVPGPLRGRLSDPMSGHVSGPRQKASTQ